MLLLKNKFHKKWLFCKQLLLPYSLTHHKLTPLKTAEKMSPWKRLKVPVLRLYVADTMNKDSKGTFQKSELKKKISFFA